MQIISMGMSYGKSLNCPDAYNDMFSLSYLWSALAKALGFEDSDVCSKGGDCSRFKATANRKSQQAEVPHQNLTVSMKSPTRRTARSRGDLGHQRRTAAGDTMAGAGIFSEVWTKLTNALSNLSSMTGFLTSAQTPPHPVPHPDDNPVAGSCYCGCPPDLLVGTCFNVKKDRVPADKSCSSIKVPQVIALPAVCPAIGLVLQCDPATYDAEEMCSNETLQGGGMKCHSITGCEPSQSLPSTWQATCRCHPTHWVDDNGDPTCVWSDQPCIYSAYVTP